MSTTQAKLNRLIETKSSIRQKIISLGVDVPVDTPFKDYPSFIEQLGGAEFLETTTDQDLLQLLDLYRWLGTAEYENHTYSDEEIQAVHDLLDLINEGEKQVVIGPGTPKLLVSVSGKTLYYTGETFSLDGYVILAVYENGDFIDVTERCTFTPNTALTVDDTEITISCTIDDVTYSVVKPIEIEIAPTYLDYIQSTGTQYIDTGITMASDIKIELTFSVPVQVSESMIMGAWDSNTNGFLLGLCGSTGSGFRYAYANSAWNGNTVTYDANVHTAVVDNTSATLDGTVLASPGNKSINSTSTIRICQWGTQSGSFPRGTVRIYGVKIYRDGRLVQNLVPVKNNINDIYCMYDKVERVYYYNRGTGSFTGSDFEPSVIDYIESTGIQYIDTGFYPTGNTRYELKIQNNTKAGVLFGAYNSTWTNGSGFYTNIGTSNNVDFVHYNSNTATTHISSSEYEMVIDKGVTTIDDTEYANIATKSFTVTRPLYIFAGNMGGALEQPTAYRLCYFKIYDNDVLVRDFKPIRDTEGIYGLYDSVTNGCYYNRGSGSFIGPGYIPTYIDYVESAGSQYIDTDVLSTNISRIDMSFVPLTNTTNWESICYIEKNASPWSGLGLRLNTSQQFGFGCGTNSTALTDVTPVIGKKYDFDWNCLSGELIINDDAYTIPVVNAPFSGHLYLFAANTLSSGTDGSPSMYSMIRLHHFKIYDINGVLIRDFRPIKDGAGTCCLYDETNKTHYYNKGSGAFIAGPEKTVEEVEE